jgi:hypothetical protein
MMLGRRTRRAGVRRGAVRADNKVRRVMQVVYQDSVIPSTTSLGTCVFVIALPSW